MSSFKDTFGKGDGAESNLRYDDAAFQYFFSALLISVAVPLLYSIIKSFYSNIEYYRFCKCQICQEKVKKLKKIHKNDWLTGGFVLKVFILVLILITLSASLQNITEQKQIKGFDPYETLEVEEGADLQTIKRAYRKLTLIYHPDKNKDDPQATAKFILISKAYECLTDEKAKAICLKYGNPDGPGSFNVGIALPSFLLKKENHVAVLALFFIVILIIIPLAVIFWYQESSRYGLDGIVQDNKLRYYQKMNENLTHKCCPELLCLSEEFQAIPVKTREESLELKKIETQVMPLLQKPTIRSQYQKPLLLASAYMMGIKVSDQLQKDMNMLLKLSPKLIDGMIDIAANFRQRSKMYRYMGLRCLMNLIDFKQCMIQGLWNNDPCLLQLACLNKEMLEKKQKQCKKLPTLLDLINDDPSSTDRPASKFLGTFSDEEREQISKEVSLFPKMNVSVVVEVPDEQEIMVNDIVSVKIQLERTNLGEKQEAGFVHSVNYPHQKEENWFVMLYDEEHEHLIYFKYLSGKGKKQETVFKYCASHAGEFRWTVMVKPDSYRGMDHKIDVKFITRPENYIQREVIVHPDDLKLDREPSFFQQVMQGISGQDDSDEELEEEEMQKAEQEYNEEQEKLKKEQ